ncbi:hypothetical protein HDV00_009441 [Rhizophlyctis rosea]|nr:hypothetical protein HDV00_009441 [Rhizophlyctis rosea]
MSSILENVLPEGFDEDFFNSPETAIGSPDIPEDPMAVDPVQNKEEDDNQISIPVIGVVNDNESGDPAKHKQEEEEDSGSDTDYDVDDEDGEEKEKMPLPPVESPDYLPALIKAEKVTNYQLAQLVLSLIPIHRFDPNTKQWWMFEQHTWRIVDDADPIPTLILKVVPDIIRGVLTTEKMEASFVTNEEVTAFVERLQGRLSSVAKFCGLLAKEVGLEKDKLFSREAPYKDFIGFNNGVLDLKTATLRDGKPDDYVRHHCDYDYTRLRASDAEKLWEDILIKIFPDKDELDYQMTYLSTVLMRGTPKQKTVILRGPGSDGKSIFIQLACKTLGAMGVSSSANLLAEKLSGKSPNDVWVDALHADFLGLLEADVASRWLASPWKLLTGGDDVKVRRNYGRAEKGKLTVTGLVGTNHIPLILDTSDGTWRRMVVCPTRSKFVETPDQVDAEHHKYPADPLLGDRLDDYRQFMMGALVEYHMDHRQQPNYPSIALPPAYQKATQLFIEQCNPCAVFLKSYTAFGKDHKESLTSLVRAFRQYHKKSVWKNLTVEDKQFKEYMKEIGLEIPSGKRRAGKAHPERVVIGLKLNERGERLAKNYMKGI